MFNFFDEIKQKTTRCKELIHDFNLVNISGRILYVEGHKGITSFTSEQISFFTCNAKVVVYGESLVLTELSSNTMLIEGKIVKTEIL